MKQICIAALVLSAFSAQAVGRYVSKSGTWTMPDAGESPACYTTLYQALEEVEDGDTIYLQDGFVTESGVKDLSGGRKVRGYVGKKECHDSQCVWICRRGK